MHRGAVVLATDDGVDPVGELCHRREGVWVEAGATASTDEGVDALNQPVADQGPPRVPLRTQTGSEGWPSRALAVAQAGAGGGAPRRGPGWGPGDPGTYKADAGLPAWHQRAHVGTGAQGGHHGHVELLQDVGRWLGCAQLAPAHGQALHPTAHTLILGRQPGHPYVAVDGG